MTLVEVPRHPAPYSGALLPVLAALVDLHAPRRTRRPTRVLDPFAGTGRVHGLVALVEEPIETWGVELMPRWAALHPRTLHGDATALPREWSGRFDAIVTSPCYGNRFADHHDARDVCSECDGRPNLWEWLVAGRWSSRCPKCGGNGLSPRRSYAHYYGRDRFLHDAPRDRNAGLMHFGDEYRDLHERAWREARRVLAKDGVLILNIKNFVRDGEVVDVAGWHRRTLEALGFRRLGTKSVTLRGFRHGANRDARETGERVYLFARS